MFWAIGQLKLSPPVFWSLSFKEILFTLYLLPSTMAPPTREALSELMQRFPDEPN